MNKEQATKIIQTLDDQGFLALDDEITLDEMVELVLNIASRNFTVEEVVMVLHEYDHLCIDDGQLKDVCELAESLVK